MIEKGSAIELGFFDGVHLAHQKIIRNAVNYAKLNNLSPIALSFDKSPSEILQGRDICYLTENCDKEHLIDSLGASLELLPTDSTLLSMEAEDFIEKILVQKFNIRYVVCGYDYRFGKNGRGDTSLLVREGERFGFKVDVIPCEMYEGESVSSSRIRKLLEEGNPALANALLGRNFFIKGIVEEGKKLGRKIGFPTANIFLGNKSVCLKNGVYKTLVTVDNKSFTAITNCGTNPTVHDKSLRAETHIPDFSGDLYGKEIRIEFLEFIRPEIRFKDIDELKNQISKDLEKI